MSEWRPEQYDPAAHQQRVNQQQTPPSNSDPWQPTRAFEQPQQPWPPSQSFGQPPSYPPQQPYGQPQQQPGLSGPGGGRRNRRKRNGILLGVIAVLIFFIGVGVGAASNTGSTGSTSPTATGTATGSPAASLAGKTAKALHTEKKKTPKKTHTAVPSSKAPSTPAQTTHAAPPATSAPPAPPPSTAPAHCYPLTNGVTATSLANTAATVTTVCPVWQVTARRSSANTTTAGAGKLPERALTRCAAQTGAPRSKPGDASHILTEKPQRQVYISAGPCRQSRDG